MEIVSEVEEVIQLVRAEIEEKNRIRLEQE